MKNFLKKYKTPIIILLVCLIFWDIFLTELVNNTNSIGYFSMLIILIICYIVTMVIFRLTKVDKFVEKFIDVIIAVIYHPIDKE